MTKKHFEYAAKLVKKAESKHGKDNADKIKEYFIELFSEFNYKFDIGRFEKACEKEGF